tara:strand:+ start:1382 stop:3316 length:1935 start_codon:yes stop_codon:yes gene_type:complete
MALIEITDLQRQFEMGGETVRALDRITLSIEAGEMLAIVGASGSGKSTLMNILGLLDRPTGGSYVFAGQEVSGLDRDELARLRRERFGFIFQRYHLMSNLTAAANVEVPAVYERIGSADRARRSRALLTRLGLEERIGYRPNKLSGGQQQRVSIARALMNGGEVILADEPTGALDTRSGEAVMAILKELNALGHTIIIVTHDMAVAEQADRVVEIRAGNIIADRRLREKQLGTPLKVGTPKRVSWVTGFAQGVGNATRMAVSSMIAQPLRTFLTMLGIIIGVAAVAAVVAVGQGSKERVATQLADLGASTLEIYPGTGWGDERAGTIRTLVASDSAAIATMPYVRAVTPTVTTSAKARYGSKSVNVSIRGVGTNYFDVYGRKLVAGRMFGSEQVDRAGTEAVIDANMAKRLFGSGNALGKIVMIGRVPVVVVGVAAQPPSGGSSEIVVYMSYTGVAARMSGSHRLDGITVRLQDSANSAAAESGLSKLMTYRHGTKDFFTFNSDQIRKTMERTSQTVSQLITAVAVIALAVGGIGVMNIMLVSVTERTKEIGLRMAVGARTSDIMLQFLVEATVICSAGAVFGVGLALMTGAILGGPEGDFPMIFSVQSIAMACAAATIVGLVFGFFPARNAALLDPVDALSRD